MPLFKLPLKIVRPHLATPTVTHLTKKRRSSYLDSIQFPLKVSIPYLRIIGWCIENLTKIMCSRYTVVAAFLFCYIVGIRNEGEALYE